MPMPGPFRAQLERIRPDLAADPIFHAYCDAMDTHGMRQLAFQLTVFEWTVLVGLVQAAVTEVKKDGPSATIGRAFVAQLAAHLNVIDPAFGPLVERGWRRR